MPLFPTCFKLTDWRIVHKHIQIKTHHSFMLRDRQTLSFMGKLSYIAGNSTLTFNLTNYSEDESKPTCRKTRQVLMPGIVHTQITKKTVLTNIPTADTTYTRIFYKNKFACSKRIPGEPPNMF